MRTGIVSVVLSWAAVKAGSPARGDEPAKEQPTTGAASHRFLAEGRDGMVPQPGHSSGVVAVDRWGNVAAVTHSINAVLWGSTRIFVGGVSIPDSAALQQDSVKRAGPGHLQLDARSHPGLVDRVNNWHPASGRKRQ
jgi:hypothetical protein